MDSSDYEILNIEHVNKYGNVQNYYIDVKGKSMLEIAEVLISWAKKNPYAEIVNVSWV